MGQMSRAGVRGLEGETRGRIAPLDGRTYRAGHSRFTVVHREIIH